MAMRPQRNSIHTGIFQAGHLRIRMAIALSSKTVPGAQTNDANERTSSQFCFPRSAARAAVALTSWRGEKPLPNSLRFDTPVRRGLRAPSQTFTS